jgi:hypothetical protein
MLIFTATFLPMNFCTRTPFIPWMPFPLWYLLLCHNSHHYCQHDNPLLILLCLITTQILVVTRVVIVATSVPTTPATTTSQGVTLLLTRDQPIGNRIGATQGLPSGLDSSMSATNCAPTSVIQLHIVPSFAAVPSNLLLTLLLGMSLLRLGSPTLAWINTSHLILQLWPILQPILIMIICMLVTVRPWHITYWKYYVTFPKTHLYII